MIDELAAAVNAEWGTDTQHWVEVNPFTTMLKVVFRTSNCVFLGPRLCRNKQLMKETVAFAKSVMPNAFLIRKLPYFLRPLMIPLITMRNKYHRGQFVKMVSPEVVVRQIDFRADLKKSLNIPNDFLQWTIEAAEASPMPYDKDPMIICERLKVVNFAAIHTSTITNTNTIFDLVSPPSSPLIIDALRREANEVLAADNNTWTKQGLKHMYKIDSTIKDRCVSGQCPLMGFCGL